jgi:hypothetical protein
MTGPGALPGGTRQGTGNPLVRFVVSAVGIGRSERVRGGAFRRSRAAPW